MQKRTADITIFIVLFAAIFAVKLDTLTEPYFWDDIGGVVQPTLDMLDNGIGFIHPRYNFGHPPLQHLLLFVIWKIFGYSIFITHIINLIIASTGLFLTYKLGESLFSPKVGIGAAILLLFSPLFFAQSGIVNDSMPLLALSVATVYFYVKNKKMATAIAGCLLVLIKEIGVLVPFSLWLNSLYKSPELKMVINGKIKLNLKKKIKLLHRFTVDSWHLAVSTIPLSVWLIYIQLNTATSVRTDLIYNLKYFFLIFWKNFSRLLVYDTTASGLTKYHWIIFFIIVFALLTKYRDKQKYYLLVLVITLQLILFSATDDLVRYFTPLLPFYYLIGSHATYILVKKLKVKKFLFYGVILLVSGLFTTSYYGNRNAPAWMLESNMEYRDMITVRKSAAEYLSDNYPSQLIITEWPFTDQLTEPRLGYVSTPLSVKDVTLHRPDQYTTQKENINIDYLLTLTGAIVIRDARQGNIILYNLINHRNLIPKRIIDINNRIVGIFEIP